MNDEQTVERLDKLIQKGKSVLETHRPNSPGVIGFPTLDTGVFAEWRTQSQAYLSSLLEADHAYVVSFKSVREPRQGHTQHGLGVLNALREDLTNGYVARSQPVNSTFLVEQICSRFHLVARQLRSRHDTRPTLDVADEYDVQDLFHGLLHLHFDDIRPEEYTPSYAGKSTRMDFLLKSEQIVIEVKKTRQGLGPKELSQQLIEDIERYKAHNDCQTLICFVYDPDGYIPNPRGIEADLHRDGAPFPVRVLIRP